MQRDPHSHKTQNGTIAVVGGSPRFHGAPIFTALAAEASGVDLVFPFVHSAHEIPTRIASPGFIVRTFRGESLSAADVPVLLALIRELHVCVIGPGLAETKNNEGYVGQIVAKSPCPLILDAGALRPKIVKQIRSGTTVILTPHLGELEELTGKNLTDASWTEVLQIVKDLARRTGAIVLLKGWKDCIVDPKGRQKIITGGHPGLTKGGTGDALAGLLAGVLAQGMEPFDACVLAAGVIKRVGATLGKSQGFAYRTIDVIAEIPYALASLSPPRTVRG